MLTSVPKVVLWLISILIVACDPGQESLTFALGFLRAVFLNPVAGLALDFLNGCKSCLSTLCCEDQLSNSKLGTQGQDQATHGQGAMM